MSLRLDWRQRSVTHNFTDSSRLPHPFRVYRVNANANSHLVLLVLLGRPSHAPSRQPDIPRPAEACSRRSYTRVQPGQWKEMRLEGFLRTIICISPAILTGLVTHKRHPPHVPLRGLFQADSDRNFSGPS